MASGGWAQPWEPDPHQVTAMAAQRLADAVRTWRDRRSTGNEERVVLALAEYDRHAGRPS